jgi:multiple sugar transport system permease protein/raffinose/stachyose/melibiose transport system permease protein
VSTRRIGWSAAFLAVPLIAYVAAVVGPGLYSFYYSLTDWNAVGGTAEFIGLQHYRDMAGDEHFWQALKNTAIWTAAAVVVPTLVGLALALGLARVRRMQRLIKSLFFLPLALSLVVVGQVWFWIFRPEDGLLNLALGRVGLASLQHAWLADPRLALWSVLLAWCWQQVSLAMVVFLAGLTGVPQELVEASKVDGANGWQRLWHVIIPALRPAFAVVVSLSMINALKSFDIVYVMTEGGPFRKTETLAILVYRTAFKTYDFGYASAISVVLFVITLVTIGLFFAWTNREDSQNV